MPQPPAPPIPEKILRPSPDAVLVFWRAAGPSRWFRKDEAFDAEFRTLFLDAHEAAARGELDAWQGTPESSLALVLLLDQFPRNAFRGTARMFATDAQALGAAKRAVAAGRDRQVGNDLRPFFYLPYEHSENLEDQEQGVALARALGGETYRFALLHRDIVARFGRFPHRNPLVGRPTTVEEQRFLDEGGFSG